MVCWQRFRSVCESRQRVRARFGNKNVAVGYRVNRSSSLAQKGI